MNTWLTADLHLGHQKVAELREYSDTASHDAAIEQAWRRQVRPEDTVYVLGDVSLGNWRQALETMASWPGVKRLIVGNHDRCFPGQRNSGAYQKEYLEVFESVELGAVLRRDGRRIILSHFPYDGDHQRQDREEQWRLRDLGFPLIHGHTHSTGRLSTSKKGTTQICVSREAWGRPVPLGEVAYLF